MLALGAAMKELQPTHADKCSARRGKVMSRTNVTLDKAIDWADAGNGIVRTQLPDGAFLLWGVGSAEFRRILSPH